MNNKWRSTVNYILYKVRILKTLSWMKEDRNIRNKDTNDYNIYQEWEKINTLLGKTSCNNFWKYGMRIKMIYIYNFANTGSTFELSSDIRVWLYACNLYVFDEIVSCLLLWMGESTSDVLFWGLIGYAHFCLWLIKWCLAQILFYAYGQFRKVLSHAMNK